MKTFDLRIGNWISVDSKQSIQDLIITGIVTHSINIRVNSISDTKINFVAGDKAYEESEILPIPLTKEWLDSFGFETIEHGDGYHGGSGIRMKKRHPKHPFAKDIEIYSTEGDFYYVGINHLVVQYVHELQNLYFALTNDILQRA